MFKGAIVRKLKKSKFEISEKVSQKAIEILKNYQQKLHYSQGYLFPGEMYIDSDQREKAMEYLKMPGTISRICR